MFLWYPILLLSVSLCSYNSCSFLQETRGEGSGVQGWCLFSSMLNPQHLTQGLAYSNWCTPSISICQLLFLDRLYCSEEEDSSRKMKRKKSKGKWQGMTVFGYQAPGQRRPLPGCSFRACPPQSWWGMPVWCGCRPSSIPRACTTDELPGNPHRNFL